MPGSPPAQRRRAPPSRPSSPIRRSRSRSWCRRPSKAASAARAKGRRSPALFACARSRAIPLLQRTSRGEGDGTVRHSAGDRRPFLLARGRARSHFFSEPAEERAMAQSAKPRVVGFNHVALEVGDIEEALAFWGRLFEFELRGKSDTMAFIDLGDQFLALQKGRKQPPDGALHFVLVVREDAR